MSRDALETDDLPRPGDVVGHKYEIEAILGTGAMGVVFSACHIDLGQRFAIKFLHPQVAQDQAAITRFLREARAASGIQSEHVVRVHDVARTESGTPYLVMEYLTGTDLQRLGHARGPLPISEVIGYILQACEALAEAHVAGIVHRDLKPGNLFLTHHADGSPLVKVLDFGISKLRSAGQVPGIPLDESLTADGQILGSPFYMSPEQLRSSKGVDARTDIWALGSMMYKLLAGRFAFQSESAVGYIAAITSEPPLALRPFRPDVPAELERVILRCLELEMSRRFQNVGEFARALQPFASPRAQLSIERILGVILSAEAITEKNAARRSDPQHSQPPSGPSGRPAPASNKERVPMPKLATVPEAPPIVSPGFAQLPSRQPDRPSASSFNAAVLSQQPSPAREPQPRQPGLKSGTVRMPAVIGHGPSPSSSPHPSWHPTHQSGPPPAPPPPPGATPARPPAHPSSPALPPPQATAQPWPQQVHQSSPALSPPQQVHQSSPALSPPRATASAWQQAQQSSPALPTWSPPTPARPSRLLPAAVSVLIAAGLAVAAWRLFFVKPQPVAPTAPTAQEASTSAPPEAPPSASAAPPSSAEVTATPTAEVTAAPTASVRPTASSSAAPTASASAVPSAPSGAVSSAPSGAVLKPLPAGPLTASVPRPPPLGSIRKLPPKVPDEKKDEKVEEPLNDHPPSPRPDGPPEHMPY
jgi:eukaryotic-like serine/threonine-protein kinase